VSCRITPERAGNTAAAATRGSTDTDHPRARGEYRSDSPNTISRRGSPPSARGIPAVPQAALAGSGITPERAGNTLFARLGHYVEGDHPRARGEY